VVLVSSKRTTPVAPMRFTSQLTLSFCVAREGKPDIFSCPPRYIRSSIESRRISHSFLGKLLAKRYAAGGQVRREMGNIWGTFPCPSGPPRSPRRLIVPSPRDLLLTAQCNGKLYGRWPRWSQSSIMDFGHKKWSLTRAVLFKKNRTT